MSAKHEGYIGHHVLTRDAVTNEYRDGGRAYSYTDQPTFGIERPDGSRYTWHASLTRLDPDDEAIDLLAQILRDEALGGAERGDGTVADVNADMLARRLIARGISVIGARP
jgi:hypothetical protein